jgi:hypothetical protein
MKALYKENQLYQKGAPILIQGFYQKSERDKDQQIRTKKIAIKFINIIPFQLEAITLNVICMDDYGEVVGKSNCEYLGLQEIVSGKTFGENIFFKVPSKSYSYQAYVTKYKANGQVVTVEKSELIPYYT